MKKQKSKKYASISWQIALTFLSLLIMVIGVCIFINSFFLEKYYIRNKQDVLKSAYSLVNDAMSSDEKNLAELTLEIQRICDVYNINMIVLDETTHTVISSRNDSDMLQKQLFEHFFGKNKQENQTADGDVLESTDNYIIQIKSDFIMKNQYIEMWGALDNGGIFMIRSAVDSITESVNLANRFLLYVGIGAGLLSVLISLWASHIISKPISELTQISERMRNLDFGAKYTGHTHNEIGILGANINNLSETLESTISELKTANNELKRDLARRTEIDDMRKEFLSNVSHELKTPIALIQGYAEGLKCCVNDDDESREYYCDVIMDESSKMNAMVSKLLTLNQLEFGTQAPTLERFNLTEMVKSFLQSVEILIKSHDAHVTLEAQENLYVWSDQFRVYEILNNYFSNALNHLEKDRKIDIRIEVMEKKARVSVFNSGNPIPEDSIDHIWEKFYKVDKARTREYGGSGVGLSIVKAIQDSLNQSYGVINFNNGVEFYFDVEM